MKVFCYSTKPYDQPFLERAAAGKHEMKYTDKRLTPETVSLATGYDAITLFTSDDASEGVLRKLAAGGIKYITLRSAGYDHVNLKTANQLNISVGNVPEYSPYSIAEHAVAMLMAVNRKIVQSQLLMQLQDFRLDSLTGFDIHGKTVGIIGTGKIGIAFARIMKGFGANVIATDPVHSDEALTLGITYVPLADLLAKCDIISIHCPLNDSTRNLFSKKEFNLMRTGSIIINTSRGPIINTLDLIEALEKGNVGAACLDVYDKEKGLFFEDHRNDVLTDPLFARIRAMRNVLITGHQAFLTHEALTGIAETTIRNLDCWQNGEPVKNQLTSNSRATVSTQGVRL